MRVHGVISNRVLLNYRCSPEVSASLLPVGLSPRLVRGHSIVGLCLIELEALRPRGLPRITGFKSMNAGYRIAVEWGRRPARYGVYLPRRDTSSRLTAWLGGRAFPGVHHRSRFETTWDADRISVKIESDDHRADVRLVGRICDRISPASLFGDLAELSAFFRDADRGFSPGYRGMDGLRLHVDDWCVSPFEIHALRADYFADHSRFPPGSLTFDSALFMRNVEHEWDEVEPPIP